MIQKEHKINYKKFIYATSFINTFIIDATYMVVSKLLNKWGWQLLVGIFVIILLIIICYGILGRYYQKHGMVCTTKEKVVTKEKNVIKKADASKKRGKKNV